MADCVRDNKALANARAITDAAERMRRARDVQHTREVREALPEGAKQAIVRLADEVSEANQRIARLERMIISLHAMTET